MFTIQGDPLARQPGNDGLVLQAPPRRCLPWVSILEWKLEKLPWPPLSS